MALCRPTGDRCRVLTESDEALYIGIDIGTSGCRALVIDSNQKILAEAKSGFPPSTQENGRHTQDPEHWWQGLELALHQLTRQIDASKVAALAVDGTSASVLLADAAGSPLTPGLMYNDGRARVEADLIRQTDDAETAAQGATSSLAKLLWFCRSQPGAGTRYFLSQCDWIVGRLTGRWGVSDYNNALKLGFDCARLEWPQWMQRLPIHHEWLPAVHAPGEPVGPLLPALQQRYGFSSTLSVVFGTTDGVAAFMASGATQPGQGVTSLGSTLVLKVLCERPLFSESYGIYSHRLGNLWLAGGASNSGGAVLLKYFELEEIERLTPLLDTDTDTGLDYYPLLEAGERFPINNPALPPRIEPVPGDRSLLFKGLLEGMARIEALGYRRLQELGAPSVFEVLTSGGGARNPAWNRIRSRILGVPVRTATSAQPAYGTALLAKGNFGPKK